MNPIVNNGYRLSLQNVCSERGFYHFEDDWAMSEYGKSIEECIELLLPRYKFAVEENNFSIRDITIEKVTYIEYDGRIFIDQHEKPEKIEVDDKIWIKFYFDE